MIDTRKAMNGVWVLTGALAVVDAIWMIASGIGVDTGAFLARLAPGAVLATLAVFYVTKRPNPTLAALLESTAFLVLFTHALAILSYLGTALGWPLFDPVFDALDKAIGFDFMAHLAFLKDHPWIARAIELAYPTSLPQIVVAVLILGFTGQLERLRGFITLFALTAMATIVTSIALPTIGTYAYYGVPDAALPAFFDPRVGWDQVAHIESLRAGTMRVIPLHDLKGLVSFPSFHTALAIVTIWALMRTRFATIPMLALNMPLILATPSNGSHYLVDILGGAVIAFAAIAFVSGWERRPARDEASAAAPNLA